MDKCRTCRHNTDPMPDFCTRPGPACRGDWDGWEAEPPPREGGARPRAVPKTAKVSKAALRLLLREVQHLELPASALDRHELNTDHDWYVLQAAELLRRRREEPPSGCASLQKNPPRLISCSRPPAADRLHRQGGSWGGGSNSPPGGAGGRGWGRAGKRSAAGSGFGPEPGGAGRNLKEDT